MNPSEQLPPMSLPIYEALKKDLSFDPEDQVQVPWDEHPWALDESFPPSIIEQIMNLNAKMLGTNDIEKIMEYMKQQDALLWFIEQQGEGSEDGDEQTQQAAEATGHVGSAAGGTVVADPPPHPGAQGQGGGDRSGEAGDQAEPIPSACSEEAAVG